MSIVFWVFKLVARISFLALLSLIIAYLLFLFFTDKPLNPMEVVEDWNNADGGGVVLLLTIYLSPAVLLFWVLFRPTRKELSETRVKYSFGDLSSKLDSAKRILEDSDNALGLGMSSSEILELISRSIRELEAGQNPDWNQLAVVFAPTGQWDDLGLSGQKTTDIANEIDEMIDCLKPRTDV